MLESGRAFGAQAQDTYSRKTLGAYRVWMLYPSLCLVSPAMTEKSAPAMARMVPPLDVYGSKCLCWGWENEPSGIVAGLGGVGGGGEKKGGRTLETTMAGYGKVYIRVL